MNNYLYEKDKSARLQKMRDQWSKVVGLAQRYSGPDEAFALTVHPIRINYSHQACHKFHVVA